jgi:hypothetical protein
MFTAFLLGLGRAARRRTPRRRPSHRPVRFRPQVLCLEERTLPSTFTVLNLNDSGPGSLRAAIASGDDTIDFAKHLHGTITLRTGELLITDSVTINGPGAKQLTVSGNDASRVVEVDASLTVAINGVTIAHGYAPDQGGGIKNDGADLTLSGDTLAQNVAYESSPTVPADEVAATAPTGNPVAGPAGIGGGVDSLGGTLTISACQITDNRALGGAGASRFGEALGGGIALLGGQHGHDQRQHV